MRKRLQVNELYSFYHHQFEIGHTLRFIGVTTFKSSLDDNMHTNYEFKLVNTWYNNNHLELEDGLTLSPIEVDNFVTPHEELIATIVDICN